jgi:CAS/CSE protein involved in chromosome segregation
VSLLCGVCVHVCSHKCFTTCGIVLLVSDEELFADNAEEYIRRDIEGSDVDTRRRAACDLVRVLSHYYEEKITGIFSSYVQVSAVHFIQVIHLCCHHRNARVTVCLISLYISISYI